MSKDKIADYDGTTAGNNTDIGGISIAEGMLPSAVNNSIRELTKQLGAFANGTDAIDALTVTGAATVNGAFTSPGIDDNANATAITIDSSERVGIATPATSNARCLLHTHPSGTGSIPTNYLVQQDDNNLGLVIMNTNDSATYSGLRIETRSTQAAGWLVANEFQSAFNGDLVFRARNAGSTSAEIARMKSSGGITFNGDTAAANTLSDYEEGTFTPQLLGGTSNPSSTVSGSGEYIKVGKLVFIYIKFHNVNTTGASGYIRITGQPFNPSQTNGPLSMSSYDFDFSGRTSLTAEINNGEINGVTSGDDTGWGLLNFGAGTSRYIFIAGSYRIA